MVLNLIHSNSSGDIRKTLVLKNITERKALELQLSNIETYDSITRMLNRKSFEAEVKQLIDSAHKHNSSHILAFFSIDQFQVINDSVGYSSGESLIKKMAEQIEKNTIPKRV